MKKIGIGYEQYKEFVDGNMYYIDKTLLIKDVVEWGGKVTLFTRPRRFGKTLALSMLRTFFEKEYDSDGNVADNHRYFEGKKIMGASEEVLSMMGRYPVIKLSLKSAKQPRYISAALRLREEIISEFSRHSYIKNSTNLDEDDVRMFNELSLGKSWDAMESEDDFKKEIDRYATALKTLSTCLKKHHGENVVVLIDEYDVPLENAYFCGFYDEMAGFIRSLFESALKTNDALEFAVITGCLRISRESIFTGLNHLVINSVRGSGFGEYFGFLQEETEKMLIEYGLKDKIEEVKQWYDGYLFGESEVYNPWSVVQYISQHMLSPNSLPGLYWANTSSNSIIKDLIEHAKGNQKLELETLISGGAIEKPIHEDITYDDIYESDDNLWNFLFFTGYMKKLEERDDGENTYIKMCIPNEEIRRIYSHQIADWFDRVKKQTDRTDLYRAIQETDTERIGSYLTELLKKSISTFDSAESFYHGFLLSLLYDMADYEARSNREEGDGRPDIVLYPQNPTDPAYIFELKVRKKFNEMEDGIKEAFCQIEEKRYEEGIFDNGYAGVISFGVCFCKKSAIVRIHK